QLFRFLDSNDTDDELVEELVETRSRHLPNSDVTAPRQRAMPQDQSLASYNNRGTQNMKGLINNSGYTKGNGMVRGLADSMDGGDRNRAMATQPESNLNLNSPLPVQATAASFLNGDNKKLLGVTNNTNIKLKGDGNRAFTLGNFK
ncbi:hypothetical protein L195_g012926, partial [Trifolium pratense]